MNPLDWLNLGSYPKTQDMRNQRDTLQRWKDEMMEVGGWWLGVDEVIRKHPDATIGDKTSDIMLRFIRERDDYKNHFEACEAQRLKLLEEREP